MKRLITALCAIALASAAICCSGPSGSSSSSSGGQVITGCREHAHPALDGGCEPDRVDGGSSVADAGYTGPYLGLCMNPNFCEFFRAEQYQRVMTDAGVQYQFMDGVAIPIHDHLVSIGEVVTALEICYSPDGDYDGDGVLNKDDSCWKTANPRPTCTSDVGCGKAGGHCTGDGVCNLQFDLSVDSVGSSCGIYDTMPDPDCDKDGIPLPDDVCPDTGTTLENNKPANCPR